MQPTGSHRLPAVLAAATAAVALLVLATTAGVDVAHADAQSEAAAQQTPANNTTVQHERPSEAAESGDAGRVSQWLERRLASRLGGSAINISQGQYERARGALSEGYESRLDQYVSVAGETESDADDRATETYREAQQDQRAYANATQAYRETYEEYERARRNGNTTAARRAARELERLSERVEGLNSSLQREYATLTNRTDVETDESRTALANTTTGIAAQQDAVRAATFVETTLTARTNASTVAFDSPVTVAGRLRLANGTALANATGRLAVADRTYPVTTDSEGRFAVSYRPVSLPVNATSARVRFLPATTSVYLGSASAVSVAVRQVTPRLELTATPTGGGFGDPLTATAVATVDGRPVPSLPIRARLGDTVVSGRTDTSGRVTLSPRVPAALPPGERSLRVAHARSAVAVGPNATATTVTVTESETDLTVAATNEGRLRVRGRLQTTDGDGIGGRQLRLSLDGTNRSVTTNATGWYRLTVANASTLDGASNGTLAVQARFDGDGTNLGDSRAETSVALASGAGGEADSSPPLVLGGVVVGVLVVAGVVGWSRRQRGRVSSEPGTTAPEPTPTGAETSAPSETWLDRARSALAAGDDERAIVTAYGAVRRHLDRDAGLAPTLTHREFVAAAEGELADDEALSTVATAYERTTFLGEPDSADAAAAVDAAAALLAS
ncbi:hypothetical protein [Haloarcula onubensis]|uniref:DUF4129 domain-containing protein n=1 Tax=Haloarcula onubensis TaxID=2950539 RepID=A0ABU2FJ39_9EURY|nr:hypothetical protein [Halomicroarcula sp. S3CR25-11]MDS0280770.1 hypothetical protein [Halomicroarcula sp. S3CR25-11]